MQLTVISKTLVLLISQIFNAGVDTLVLALAQPMGIFAIAAALLAVGLNISSAFVKTIIPLRWLAVGSNVGFIVYGVLNPAWLALCLHAVLLPINIFRAYQMHRLTQRVHELTTTSDASGIWLRPYMKQRKYKAGDLLFRAGDLADSLYFLVEGRIDLVELGGSIHPGHIFGEIAFFAPDRKRTSTARCASPCTLMSIDEMTFKQLYFQNPEFGFEVVRLIAGRLSNDVSVLQSRISENRKLNPVSN